MQELCEDLLRRMIIGDDALSMGEAQDHVTLLNGCQFSPQRAAVANCFLNALSLVEIGNSHELPLPIMTRLRAEALEALHLLMELRELEPA